MTSALEPLLRAHPHFLLARASNSLSHFSGEREREKEKEGVREREKEKEGVKERERKRKRE